MQSLGAFREVIGGKIVGGGWLSRLFTLALILAQVY